MVGCLAGVVKSDPLRAFMVDRVDDQLPKNPDAQRISTPGESQPPSSPRNSADSPRTRAATGLVTWAGVRQDDEEVTDISAGSRSLSRDRIVAGVITVLVHGTVLLLLACLCLPGPIYDRIFTPDPPPSKRRVIKLLPPEQDEVFWDDPVIVDHDDKNVVEEPPSPDPIDIKPFPVTLVDSISATLDRENETLSQLKISDLAHEIPVNQILDLSRPYPYRENPDYWALKNGGSKETEQAVKDALEWLKRHQTDDGSWSFDLHVCPDCRGRCGNSGNRKDNRTAATALALLPFLGRGGTPEKDGPYKETIKRGITFLVAKANRGNGKLYDEAEHDKMYSQGLAAIALAECHAMVEANRREVAKADQKKNAKKLPFEQIAGPSPLASAAQSALDVIVRAQDPQGGGWRYAPGEKSGDISVVGWQLMALHAGTLGGLRVDRQTLWKARDFLDAVQADPAGATYGYQTKGDPEPRRAAIGLLCRMYLRWKQDDPGLQDGRNRLAAKGPTSDLYYDYYATQVMYHMEGEPWEAWNKKMIARLLRWQVQKDGHEKGSWFEGVNGYEAADTAGGRLYSTALATMILEVYYRHLRIYCVYPRPGDEFRE